MNIIKVYAKTVVAFLVTLIGNMIVNLVNGNTPWPQNTAQWIQFLVTSVVVALGVAAVPNRLTQNQVDAAVEKGHVAAPVPGHTPWPA